MTRSYFFHFAPVRGRMIAPNPPQPAPAPLSEHGAPGGEPRSDSLCERSGQGDARRKEPGRGWRDEDERW